MPPCWHGLDSHSLRFTSQLVPAQPGSHSHWYLQERQNKVKGSYLLQGSPTHCYSNPSGQPGGTNLICSYCYKHPKAITGENPEQAACSILLGSEHPAGKFLPIDVIVACAVHTRAAVALIHLWIAMWTMETLWAKAREAVFAIHTGTTIFAGIGCTLINLDVTQGT